MYAIGQPSHVFLNRRVFVPCHQIRMLLCRTVDSASQKCNATFYEADLTVADSYCSLTQLAYNDVAINARHRPGDTLASQYTDIYQSSCATTYRRGSPIQTFMLPILSIYDLHTTETICIDLHNGQRTQSLRSNGVEDQTHHPFK